MTPKTHRLDARGIEVCTRTARRFIAIAVRPEDIVITAESEAHRLFGRATGTYVAFAEVIMRSDSYATAKKIATSDRKRGHSGMGVKGIVIDTTTGLEV